MKCIYASKLYRASKRKDKIAAALVDSANVGLIQQLATSLDDEYQKKDLIDPESDDKEKSSPRSEGQNNTAGSAPSGGSHSSGGGGGSLSGSFATGMDEDSFDPETDLMEYPEGEEGELSEGEEESAAAELEGPDTGVKEATQIKACTLDTNQLTVLRDSLNINNESKGVTRIVAKENENELWIYYNDDINLNNIMTDVIEYVAQAYNFLEFNRLARSDNAIVFEVSKSTPLDQTIKEV